jgi:hypothetical protein
MPSFDHIRYRHHDSAAFLYAFDLIELNGDDLRSVRHACKLGLEGIVSKRKDLSPLITKIAPARTAMRRRARPPLQHSRRAGERE